MLSRFLVRTASSRGTLSASSRRPFARPLLPPARLASVLVVADPLQDDGTLPVATQSAVTAAMEWIKTKGDATNDCVLLTTGPVSPPDTHAIPTDVTKLWHAQTESKVVETAANAIVQAAEKGSPDVIMGTATKWGSSVIPRAAALLQRSPLADVIAILDSHTYIRPLYAGNALAKVQVQSPEAGPQIMTIRPTAFEKAPLTETSVSVESFEANDFTLSRWQSQSVSSSDSGRPDLTAARVVVSGGRGMGSADKFAILESLADAFPGQAAVGASRAAVDAGMAPNDQQVGQTGKVVAPDLYIAAGISGAIQHISGMKDSKTIVAINKDPEAPIFQVADYSIVQDLFEAVPEMTEKIKKGS